MKTTICLSMIVKNEAHVIYKTLEQIIKYIPLSYIIICDTGSSDNTIEVINKFLTKSKIPGEVHEHEWVDFATNRNLALDISRTKADYSFIFDADDIIHANKNKFDFPNKLTHDYYRFKFDKKLTYMRPLLINNKKDFRWYGVVHECLKPTEPISVCNIQGDYYIESGHTGDRSKNEFKFLKDSYTIEKEIIRIESKKQENYSKDDKWLLPRYYFYCGQSYGDFSNRDSIFKSKCVEYYEKALNYEPTQCGDEKYFCCYRLYKLENNIKYLIESFKYDKGYRIECVIEYIIYLSKNKNYTIIKDLYYKYKNYRDIKDIHSKNLFLLKPYYNFKLEYLYSIIADKLNDFEEGLKCCNICIENNINLDLCKNNANIYKIKLNKDKSLKEISLKDSNKILFFTLFPNEKMNYSYYLNNALGGSETAIYNMATQMAQKCKDKEIIIAGNINEEEVKINDSLIKCININSLKNLLVEYKFETIIISRYLSFFDIFPHYKCNNLIVYQHDVHFLPNYKKSYSLLKNNIDKIDHIINLTEWQKNNTITLYDFLKNDENKINIINNGLDLETIKKYENNKKYRNSFIYTSRPERGLKKVLELWKEIKEQLPNATLKISSYNSCDEEYLNIIKDLKDVNFLGQLNKDELYKHISQSEYWLYPTNWQETSCITAMEMLALKVICIYYPVAGLNDTIGKYGVKITQGNEIKTITSLNDTIKAHLRTNGYNYSRTLSWSNQADKLINTLNKKKTWIFYCLKPYEVKMIEQYIINLNNNNLFNNYTISIINDKNKILNLKPDKLTFLFDSINDINFFNKLLNNTTFSYLNLEPLNINARLKVILEVFKKFPNIEYYDYSESNLKILEENKIDIQDKIYLPYKCSDNELNKLINLNKNTKKEYDFGILKALGGDITSRRLKIVNFLKENNFTVNIIEGWGNDRDLELAKCKIILNIHGFFQIPSNIFEHIRCNRLLDSGFNILSETSYKLNEEFVNKYPNLKQIEYSDFFNLDIINEHCKNESKQIIKKIYDALCLNMNPFDYYLNPIDIYEHLPTLYRYANECESILECGVRASVSSWSFVYGLLNNNSHNKKLILNDIQECNIDTLLKKTKNINLDIEYKWINNLDLILKENVDMTFIDTWHVGGHLKKELAKFSKLTNKYIIMHDTTVDEFTSEAIRANLTEEKIKELAVSSSMSIDDVKMGLWPAIEDFLKNNNDWVLHERFTNNNGLTILKKVNIQPIIKYKSYIPGWGKMCIITAATGNYNVKLPPVKKHNIDAYVFGDANITPVEGWIHIKKSFFEHEDNFIKAKYYKTQWHKISLLNSYDTVLWVDSIVEIIQIPNPKNNVEPELVTFNHPWNRWLHDEIRACTDARYNKYHIGMKKHLEMYENINWVPHTCFIINRRTTNVIKMNDIWFNDIIKYKFFTDQVSFPPSCIKAGVNFQLLDGGDSYGMTSSYYKKKPHPIRYEQYN